MPINFPLLGSADIEESWEYDRYRLYCPNGEWWNHRLRDDTSRNSALGSAEYWSQHCSTSPGPHRLQQRRDQHIAGRWGDLSEVDIQTANRLAFETAIIMEIDCPKCHAVKGETCRNLSRGYMRGLPTKHPHFERYEALHGSPAMPLRNSDD